MKGNVRGSGQRIELGLNKIGIDVQYRGPGNRGHW